MYFTHHLTYSHIHEELTMLPEERRSRIQDLLFRKATVTIAELAEQFGTSEMTIRRDLDELEGRGVCQRIHGGATSLRVQEYRPPPYPSYPQREQCQVREKIAIGQAAAALVRPGDVIVAGRNWGCGSSREQAVTCLRSAGIRIIIAKSFARIYFRNAVNNGLLPVICPEAVTAIQPGEPVTVDADRCGVHCAGPCPAGRDFPFAPLSPSVAAILRAGGLLPMLRARV
jgi:3-isopropylmalate/(R)-2-methylmalate dehydratase small subunit